MKNITLHSGNTKADAPLLHPRCVKISTLYNFSPKSNHSDRDLAIISSGKCYGFLLRMFLNFMFKILTYAILKAKMSKETEKIFL